MFGAIRRARRPHRDTSTYLPVRSWRPLEIAGLSARTHFGSWPLAWSPKRGSQSASFICRWAPVTRSPQSSPMPEISDAFVPAHRHQGVISAALADYHAIVRYVPYRVLAPFSGMVRDSPNRRPFLVAGRRYKFFTPISAVHGKTRRINHFLCIEFVPLPLHRSSGLTHDIARRCLSAHHFA